MRRVPHPVLIGHARVPVLIGHAPPPRAPARRPAHCEARRAAAGELETIEPGDESDVLGAPGGNPRAEVIHPRGDTLSGAP
jgi:hypothetical protein